MYLNSASTFEWTLQAVSLPLCQHCWSYSCASSMHAPKKTFLHTNLFEQALQRVIEKSSLVCLPPTQYSVAVWRDPLTKPQTSCQRFWRGVFPKSCTIKSGDYSERLGLCWRATFAAECFLFLFLFYCWKNTIPDSPPSYRGWMQKSWLKMLHHVAS